MRESRHPVDLGEFEEYLRIDDHQPGWLLGELGLEPEPEPEPDPLLEVLDADPPLLRGLIPTPRRPADEPQRTHTELGGPQPRRPAAHRKRRVRRASPSYQQVVNALFSWVTALTVVTISLLGWMITYDPLQILAGPLVTPGLAQLWPLMVYGPWMVASLSILRAARERRRSTHSWLVVALFSGTTAILCIARASGTVTGMIVAGLPPITAVVCLQQLVHQISGAKSAARHAPAGRPGPARQGSPRARR